MKAMFMYMLFQLTCARWRFAGIWLSTVTLCNVVVWCYRQYRGIKHLVINMQLVPSSSFTFFGCFCLQLASAMLSLFDPTLEPEPEAPLDLLKLIPMYRSPKVQAGYLPGTARLSSSLPQSYQPSTPSDNKLFLFQSLYHNIASWRVNIIERDGVQSRLPIPFLCYSLNASDSCPNTVSTCLNICLTQPCKNIKYITSIDLCCLRDPSRCTCVCPQALLLIAHELRHCLIYSIITLLLRLRRQYRIA